MFTRTAAGAALTTFFGLLAVCGAGCWRNAVGSSPGNRLADAPAQPIVDAPDELRVRIVAPGEAQASDAMPQIIDLGTVKQAESVSRTLLIENHTVQPVTLDRFQTSCECVAFGEAPLAIPADGVAAA